MKKIQINNNSPLCCKDSVHRCFRNNHIILSVCDIHIKAYGEHLASCKYQDNSRYRQQQADNRFDLIDVFM